MSAVSLTAEEDEEFDQAVETIRNAQEGDEVLFDTRKEPLTVTDTGGEPGEDRYLVVRGPRGGTYTIRESYTDKGLPDFRIDETGHSANNLRPANFEPKDRIPMFRDWGNIQQSDASPGVQTEETGETGPEGFTEFNVIEGDGELVIEGYHDETNTDFEAVYYGDNEYRLDQAESDFGSLGVSSQAIIVDDLEEYLSDEGFSIEPTTPGSAAREFESRPAEGATEVDADDYVVNNTQEVMDYSDLVEETDTPESDQPPESLIDRLTEDKEDSWTFVDEILTLGEDVPKTVNNWHLIDYGVVTDDTMDVSRKLAWYNVETESLLVLGGVQNDSETRWFVYHVPDTDDINDDERDPVYESGSLTEALDYSEEILYDSDEEVDLSVRENPSTGEVTIYDALTNSHMARALVAAKSADPYGLRTYVQEASLPQFIRDLDEMLYRLFKRAQSTSGTARQSWSAFSDGAKLPTPERIYAFLIGLDPRELGRRTRMAFLAAVTGLQKRFAGLTVYPTIKYDEFGVDVEYKYTPGDRRQNRSVLSLTTDPRITREITDDEGNVIRTEVRGFVLDSLLPRGFSYYQLVDLAEWANVNEWVFHVPDPWSDETPSFSVGTTGSTGKDYTTSGSTASDYRDLISGEPQSGTATLVRPEGLDEDTVERLVDGYSDEPEKQKYIFYLAILNAGMEQFWEADEGTDIRQLNREKNQFASEMGKYRAKFEDTFKEYGFVKDDFEWDVWYDAYGSIQWEGSDEIKALDMALDQYDESSATSDDFEDIYFRKSDEPEPEPEQSGGGEEDVDIESQGIPAPPSPPGSDGGDEETTATLSPNEQERVNTLSERLASGEETVDSLGKGDRDLLAKAEEEQGILPPGMARELSQIRSEREQGQETTEVGDMTTDDMIAQSQEFRKAAQMDADERARVVNSWADELDEDPGTGYSQEDMIPPEEREDQL